MTLNKEKVIINLLYLQIIIVLIPYSINLKSYIGIQKFLSFSILLFTLILLDNKNLLYQVKKIKKILIGLSCLTIFHLIYSICNLELSGLNDLFYYGLSCCYIIIFLSLKINKKKLIKIYWIFTSSLFFLTIEILSNKNFLIIRNISSEGYLYSSKNGLAPIVALNIILGFILFKKKSIFINSYLCLFLYLIKSRNYMLGLFIALIYYLYTEICNKNLRNTINFIIMIFSTIGIFEIKNYIINNFKELDKLGTGRLSILFPKIEYLLNNFIFGFHYKEVYLEEKFVHSTLLKPLFYGGFIYFLFYIYFVYQLWLFFKIHRNNVYLMIIGFNSMLFEVYAPFGTGSSFLHFWILLCIFQQVATIENRKRKIKKYEKIKSNDCCGNKTRNNKTGSSNR